MQIVEQSHEWIKETNPLKLIEMAGRTCYKSEDKITENSASKFVKMLTKRGHYSVLEHANICFEVTEESFDLIYSGKNYLNVSVGTRDVNSRILVSGNFRAWKEFLEAWFRYPGALTKDMKAILLYLNHHYPEVFTHTVCTLGKENPHATPVAEDIMTCEEKFIHTARTCRFVTSRVIQQELTRHRPWAYSIESTRYVRYDGNMKFIKPVWWRAHSENDADIDAQHLWQWHMRDSEYRYKRLLDDGWRPEQARDILPLSLASEIVCTTTLSEWKHMLDLRTSKAAHPQIRALMQPVLSDLIEELPEIFAMV